jgi:hypothetical protein
MYGVLITRGSSLGRYLENYSECKIDDVLNPENLVRDEHGQILRFDTEENAQQRAKELHETFYANWDSE